MTDEVPPASATPAGWYANPSGAPGIRYFDGQQWTQFHRADPPPPPVTTQPQANWYPMPGPAYPAPPHSTVVVAGPNHGLHAVLTLLTCGAWGLIWLIVAITTQREVRVVSLPPPPPPR